VGQKNESAKRGAEPALFLNVPCIAVGVMADLSLSEPLCIAAAVVASLL
jgi:hypothetical protein